MSDLKDDTNPDKLIEATENLEISEGGKKKKNKKKKKVAEPSENAENLEPHENDADAPATTEGDEEEKTKKKKNKNKKKTGKIQTDPPTLPISSLFPSGNYPEGQIMEHPIAADDQKELVLNLSNGNYEASISNGQIYGKIKFIDETVQTTQRGTVLYFDFFLILIQLIHEVIFDK